MNIGENVLYQIDGYYNPGEYLGVEFKYNVFDLSSELATPEKALELYAVGDEEFMISEHLYYNQSLSDIFSCDIYPEEKYCTGRCVWNGETCKIAAGVVLNVGDITETADRAYIVLDRVLDEPPVVIVKPTGDGYEIDDVELVTLDNIIRVADVAALPCNNIVYLAHGTTDKGLISILSENKIKRGRGELSGVKDTNRVSTYPILNCDFEKRLPMSSLYSENTIFLRNDILDMYPNNWRVTVKTNTAGATIGESFSNGNIVRYYKNVSPYRYNIWSDTPEEEKEYGRDDERNINHFLGELAFSVDLESIIEHIAYIVIIASKTKLIDYVESLGIKVVTITSVFAEHSPVKP